MQAPPTFDDWADGHEEQEKSCRDCVHAFKSWNSWFEDVSMSFCYKLYLIQASIFAATCHHYEEDDVCPF